jgi:hypothetical protein
MCSICFANSGAASLLILVRLGAVANGTKLRKLRDCPSRTEGREKLAEGFQPYEVLQVAVYGNAPWKEEIKARELYAARSLGTKVFPQRFQNTSSGDKHATSIPAE